MATRDTIVIGASAGGVQALLTLVADLPRNLPAAVFIVLHVSANAPSLLPSLLERQSKLKVAHAVDGEPIVRGHIYVAPPDQHLIIEDNKVRLVHGPKENLHRPSIDALFQTLITASGMRSSSAISRLSIGPLGRRCPYPPFKYGAICGPSPLTRNPATENPVPPMEVVRL